MIPTERLRELAASPIADESLLAAELLAARETIAAVGRHRDDLLELNHLDNEAARVAVLSGRENKFRFGAMTTRDAIAEVVAQRDAARAEAKKYHDALVARHGGEPVALLSELDAARADAKQARRDGQEIASGLHEKLAEVRAECARVAKQRDDLLAAAEPVADALRDIAGGGHGVYLDAYQAAVEAMAAEQPKPACHLCNLPMPDGTDGHGLGECVPVCPTCDGSGTAEQPKPVAWPHLPEVDRPDSEVQP